jgi:hypothetical protein
MFDHKPIFLSFRSANSGSDFSDKLKSKKRITNWFLDDNLIHMSVTLSTLQMYSKSIDENLHGETIVRLNRGINYLCSKMLSLLELRGKNSLNSEGNFNDEMLMAAYYSEFKECVDDLPSWEDLSA